MTGHRPFADLREKMTPAQRKAINERAASLHAEITLAERQQASQLTQQPSAATQAVGLDAIAEPAKP